MRLVPVSAFAAALALSACGENGEAETVDVPVGEATGGNVTQTETTTDPTFGEAAEATPMNERVATLGLLNKRNNKTVDIELRPGETREEGRVIVRLSACERTSPLEMPQETGAFVQLDVLERGESRHTRVFSGWLFKESPSRNVVEHPVYDVWVKDCAMRYPGEPELETADEEETGSEDDA